VQGRKEQGWKREDASPSPVSDWIAIRSHHVPQLQASIGRGGDKLILIRLAPTAVVQAFLR